MRRAAVVSFRLGGLDGVSVEAAKWAWALEQLGFVTYRVAGRFLDGGRPGDVQIPALRLEDPTGTPTAELAAALAEALAPADLVVAENILSLPLNPTASAALLEVVADRRVLLHHHDLPWQRPGLWRTVAPGRDPVGHLELPPDLPHGVHVVINRRSQRELWERRRIRSTVLYNRVDTRRTLPPRALARRVADVPPEVILLLQPTRAIARKGIPRGLAYAERLAALVDRPVWYWITGPAEEGYGPTLEALIRRARIPVRHRPAPTVEVAYAACDAVVFPSTWEGFGNPVVEGAWARRPVAAGRYPVLAELEALGLVTLPLEDPAALARWLADPDPTLLDRNVVVVHRHLDMVDLPRDLASVLHHAGWTDLIATAEAGGR